MDLLYIGNKERKKSKRKGKEGEQGNKWEGRVKGKGEREKGRGKKENNPHLIYPLVIFLLPNDLTKNMRKRKNMSKKIIRRSKRKTKEKPVQGDFSRSQHVQLNHSTKPQVENEKGKQEKGRKKNNNNN